MVFHLLNDFVITNYFIIINVVLYSSYHNFLNLIQPQLTFY